MDSDIAFEVASVKKAPSSPTEIEVNGSIAGRLVRFRYASLENLIKVAWQVKSHQIIGPKWRESAGHYDITATLPESADKKLMPVMLRALLEERFHLEVHTESRVMPVYNLVSTDGDHKLKPSVAIPEPVDANGRLIISALIAAEKSGKAVRGSRVGGGKLTAGNFTVGALADSLSNLLEHLVIDRTNFPGKYDFDISVAPTDVAARWSAIFPASNASEQAESIFSSIRKYGLKLEKGMSPVNVVVIDHVDKEPAPN